ncbi:MAG: phosphoserine phosphatase [Cellvibrionales bacterium TMED49]|nr:HAD-IB family hydrolase [Porticoccaceae bacterium]OUU39157.1 MAG: phosphoserine phosphatase [Cellvibrionales bacterium TMED49]|tara:strand:- start:29 stop:685 length:657 start_codon:yes stop_codon:yes gene_type:complete
MALALFDLDNTLIAGDSDHSWGQFLVDEGYVSKSFYKEQNDKFLSDYITGELDICEYLKFSLGFLGETSFAELTDLRNRFVNSVVKPMQLPKAKALLETHRNAGDQLVIITSTNSFIVQPICSMLGVTDIISTDLVTFNGEFTGEVQGVVPFREGKVIRLNLWLSETNASLKNSWFYSDSVNDIPLMQIVSNPVAVDPDDKLRSIAKDRDWKIISLRK